MASKRYLFKIEKSNVPNCDLFSWADKYGLSWAEPGEELDLRLSFDPENAGSSGMFCSCESELSQAACGVKRFFLARAQRSAEDEYKCLLQLDGLRGCRWGDTPLAFFLGTLRNCSDGIGLPAIMMSMAQGEPLNKLVANNRISGDEARPPLSAEVAKVGLAIVRTYRFIHMRGVRHRDLSPSNLFLENRRGQWHITPIDFGNAILGDPSITFRRPATASYGAPEAFLLENMGRKETRHAYPQDIWSIGAVLYYVKSGETPHGREMVEAYEEVDRFDTRALFERFREIKKNPLVLPEERSKTGDALPSDPGKAMLQECIAQCTKFEPEDRVSLEGLEDMLSKIIDGSYHSPSCSPSSVSGALKDDLPVRKQTEIRNPDSTLSIRRTQVKAGSRSPAHCAEGAALEENGSPSKGLAGEGKTVSYDGLLHEAMLNGDDAFKLIRLQEEMKRGVYGPEIQEEAKRRQEEADRNYNEAVRKWAESEAKARKKARNLDKAHRLLVVVIVASVASLCCYLFVPFEWRYVMLSALFTVGFAAAAFALCFVLKSKEKLLTLFSAILVFAMAVELVIFAEGWVSGSVPYLIAEQYTESEMDNEAAAWTQLSAEMGYPLGELEYALILEKNSGDGNEVASLRDKAFSTLSEKGMDGSDSERCSLAACYLHGWGTAANYDKTLELCLSLKDSNAGEGEVADWANYVAGYILYCGMSDRGIAKDEAVRYFELAESGNSQGSEFSMIAAEWLAHIYLYDSELENKDAAQGLIDSYSLSSEAVSDPPIP